MSDFAICVTAHLFLLKMNQCNVTLNIIAKYFCISILIFLVHICLSFAVGLAQIPMYIVMYRK